MRPFGPAATLFEARAHRRYFLVEKTWIFGLFCRNNHAGLPEVAFFSIIIKQRVKAQPKL